MTKQIIEILKSNFKQNIAAIGFFENFHLEKYFTKNNSILLYGASDHYWTHIASNSKSDLEFLLSENHNESKYFFSVEDWIIPVIKKYGNIDWQMDTKRFILPSHIEIKKPVSKLSKIDIKYASFIHENSDYKAYTSIEYIKERLDNDISLGIFEKNNLIAWGFTHDDGALGFLHVLNDRREKGYGLDIVLGLTELKKKDNKPVFVNIVPENKKAIQLVSKIGFVFDRNVSWLKLI